MAVAKRRGREKPAKIEQRKVWGPEWGAQVEKKTPLASPIYIGQAQREKKHINRGAKGLGVSLIHAGALFSLHLWVDMLSRHAEGFNVHHSKSLLWWDRTEEHTLAWQWHRGSDRFKELDLIECLKNSRQRFMTLYRRQWLRLSPRKRNAKRQNSWLRRPYKELWKKREVDRTVKMAEE